ncbi:MAG: N-acetyl sugar amidotransferase [Pseudomonadota bacterium]
MNSEALKTCVRCVMDESASNIRFDNFGVCNFCTDFAAKLPELSKTQHDSNAFKQLVDKIKKVGQGKPYDCVVGLSGGVDSSYVLHLVVEAGLRPIAVHLDNGWNSELAVANIHSLISRLNIDLYTHVIDWEENRDMQLSMFAAGVIDIELLMDNAMLAVNCQIAKKYKLHHVVSGSNKATEGIRMPKGWNHFKLDVCNIRAIHKRFGKVPIKTHPLISTVDHLCFKYLSKIEWVSLLDFVDYNKQAAVDLLVKRYGYVPYPYKHYESVFTRFYQGYILPRKFGVDKRRVHLSTLILSNQMTREEALEDLKNPPYDPVQLQRDQQFILKKFGVDEAWFNEYLSAPNHLHLDYPSELPRWEHWLALWAKLKSRKVVKGTM